ncbi:major facilitator superfamily domain-containing protein 3 isoform X2 [Aplysia californica]|uniref:Major facilitator superfamily domain-containing protein 3 isoform X2 n=1 Tax=Aplysia californica TaxID=6500 RepID=A0ABM1VQ78_APLCA|nr:major facilitator superfamily domain-containing protein 3 isoform X2 [Aplysia californica]
MNVVRSSSSQEYKTRIRTFFVLYFLQGLPHGLQSGFLPLFFRAHGMSLANVSLYKLLLIPWVLKAVWAPIVDLYGHKKLWLTWSLIALIFISVTASNVSPSDYTSLTGILFIFNLITSVQDIAVDAFLIDVLTPTQLATGNTAQVVGYKAGSLFAGGVFAWFIDLLSLRVIFITLAILYTLGLLVNITYLPYTDSAKVHQISPNAQQRTSTNNLVTGTVQPNATNQSQSLSHGDGRWFFLKMFETDGTLWMLAFMLLYKTGENGVTNLLPLFLLDEGVHAHDVGFWTGMVGQGMSILGSAVGGFIFTSSMTTSLQIQLTSRTVSVLFIWLSVLLWSSSFPFVNANWPPEVHTTHRAWHHIVAA